MIMTTYTIKTNKFSVISLHNSYEEKKIIKINAFHKKHTKKPNNFFIELINKNPKRKRDKLREDRFKE